MLHCGKLPRSRRDPSFQAANYAHISAAYYRPFIGFLGPLINQFEGAGLTRDEKPDGAAPFN
jgi:hypothetical protein